MRETNRGETGKSGLVSHRRSDTPVKVRRNEFERGEQVEKSVTIERSYIPLCQVLAQEPVITALQRRGINMVQPEMLRLSRSERTFEQYTCLFGGENLPEMLLTGIQQALEAADKTAPVLMTEQYPWLKGSSWILEMRDVSHYKVTVQFDAETFVNIRRVCREQEAAGELADVNGAGSVVLRLYLEKVPAICEMDCRLEGMGMKVPVEACSDGEVLKITVKERVTMQQMVKELILNGNLDLRRYVAGECKI